MALSSTEMVKADIDGTGLGQFFGLLNLRGLLDMQMETAAQETEYSLQFHCQIWIRDKYEPKLCGT